VQDAARVLARAFHDDPVFSWMFPAEGSRPRRLRRYFATELRHESLRHGAVDLASVDGRMAGVAAWFPPGTWSPGTELSALPGYLRAFGRRLGSGSRYLSAASRTHPHQEPHWYLAIIGAHTGPAGSGVGAALLRSRLRGCDEGGCPPTSNPQSRRTCRSTSTSASRSPAPWTWKTRP
jgi:hypothetical protein